MFRHLWRQLQKRSTTIRRHRLLLVEALERREVLTTTQGYVDKLYHAVLHRAEAQGEAFWVQAIDSERSIACRPPPPLSFRTKP